jgi:hemerythrin-like domain-containing protein
MGKNLLGFNAPAAGFDAPLDMLAACHGRIGHLLDTIGRLQAHLPARGADAEAQGAASRILRYFDTAGSKHHADEEADLFPLLESRSALGSLLPRLRADHRDMEAAYAALRPGLAAVAEGNAKQWQDAAAARFCLLYRRHIVLEDAELIPAASRVLSAADQKQLGRSMAERRKGAT